MTSPFLLLFLALCLLLTTNVALESNKATSQKDRTLQLFLRSDGQFNTERNVQTEEQVLALGAIVYSDFNDDVWNWGKITTYSDSGYFIDWIDGSSDVIDDAEWVYRMVACAYNAVTNGDLNYEGETQVFANGTKLYWKHDDVWWWGSISDYDNDATYTVTWSDGNDEDFSEFEHVLHMVLNAFKESHSDDFLYSDGQVFLVGTYVSTRTPPVKGSITYFDEDEETYTVELEDGTQNTYTDVEAMKSMVSAASELVLEGYTNDQGIPAVFALGSVVYYEFDISNEVGDNDPWYEGTIAAYDYNSGTYEVLWTGHWVDEISDQSKMLKMVLQGVTHLGVVDVTISKPTLDSNDTTASSAPADQNDFGGNVPSPTPTPIDKSTSDGNRYSTTGSAAIALYVIGGLMIVGLIVLTMCRMKKKKDLWRVTDQ